MTKEEIENLPVGTKLVWKAKLANMHGDGYATHLVLCTYQGMDGRDGMAMFTLAAKFEDLQEVPKEILDMQEKGAFTNGDKVEVTPEGKIVKITKAVTAHGNG